MPIEIRDFMLERITTYEQLETIFWLATHGGAVVTSRSLETELGISELLIEDALLAMVRAHLVAEVAGKPRHYAYAPARAELDRKVKALAALYARSRSEVLRVISSNSLDRLRRSAVRTFGDCLRLAPAEGAAHDRTGEKSR